MGMPVHQPHQQWTADMVRSLPDDGQRYELIDGVLLVSPSPARQHQRAVRLLLIALQSYCEQHDLGEALDSPADIELSPNDIVQPDVFVLRDITSTWDEAGNLRLAVEVTSPLGTHRPIRETSTLSARTRAGVLDRRPGRTSVRTMAAGR